MEDIWTIDRNGCESIAVQVILNPNPGARTTNSDSAFTFDNSLRPPPQVKEQVTSTVVFGGEVQP